jgi:Tol biopolymer transport system component
VGTDSAIKIMNVGASGGNAIVHFAGRNAFQPAWSPGRDYISFSLASQDGLEAEIWVAASDGANPYRITQGNYDVRSTWSPDGTMIAFERDGQGIYKVPSSGSSGATPLFTDPMLAPAAPDWGKDAQGTERIVFQAYQAPQGPTFYGYRIARIDATGSAASLRWLTYNGSQIGDYAPKWSPDGTKILFVRETQSGSGLRKVENSTASPGPTIPPGPDASEGIGAGATEVLGADW